MNIESSEIVQIVVALIGLVCSILGLVFGNIKQLIVIRILWSIVVIAIFFVGILVWNLFDDGAIEIKITHPKDGDFVEIRESVEGRCKGIRPDQMIWVVVYSYQDNKYYPHESGATFSPHDTWISQGVVIGATSDTNKKFNISALLASLNTQQQLKEYLSDITSSGLEKLPEGTKIYDQVTVTRR